MCHGNEVFRYSLVQTRQGHFQRDRQTEEALHRHPDRFSRNRLALTIKTTASFILDAFGYNGRMGRPREVLYWPAPAIKRAHAQQGDKKRISNAAMAYFVYHLITASEFISKSSRNPEFVHWSNLQFEYVGEFLRTAGYPFPHERSKGASFAKKVDECLSGDTYSDLWANLPCIAGQLNIDLGQLTTFLLPNSSVVFDTNMNVDHNHSTCAERR